MASTLRVGNRSIILSNTTATAFIDFLIESARFTIESKDETWVSTLIEERNFLYPGADIEFTDIFPMVEQLIFWQAAIRRMRLLIENGEIGNQDDLSWRIPFLEKLEPIEKLFALEISRVRSAGSAC